MIISASRRTDLPAFFSPWFMGRLRAGCCTVTNPFNSKQVSRVSLLPEDVDVIVFWTRDPRPLLTHLPEIERRGFRYYFQFTITGYGPIFEPLAPSAEVAVASFRKLARIVGPERVIWRYDPIVLSNVTDAAYHVRNFARLTEQLAPATRRVVLSIVDAYRQTPCRFKDLARRGIEVRTRVPAEELGMTLGELAGIAREAGLEVTSCAEGSDWLPYGVRPGACIDGEYIRRVFGLNLSWPKDKGQRPGCSCVRSKDIGAYGTCRHGCIYCYAGSLADGRRNLTRHCPEAPGLLLSRR
ncbi:Domain of unknown function (DUF1848) [Acididesulfobacillus acetoxydans]|uniref:DNA repair photolyase n=1 Tax=Acididesulfobacillus acetoxydans TaxID=1561005 RepID=A0A8S0WPU3_9FIRM|nr:DUF1848 domain-containing protein [Acididesulfobacillus acetoxydans]CAA7602174.1 Domain of unknown function (DUF1848) [Acididesulfobacillus acetoxydans]CEJ08730.1 DNA repair photolyase [Acididesulfobacillus acetoxydans]